MWQLAAISNGVISLAYFGIFFAIALPLIKHGQFWSNKLGAATSAIFFSCGVGHGLHTLHALLPWLGVNSLEGYAARQVSLHDAAWALVTAFIGCYYWTLRRTYGSLMQGAALFEDLEAKQRRTELEAANAVLAARQQAQAEVEAQAAILRGIIDNDPTVIYAKDLDGRYLLTNAAWERLFGCAPGQMIGRTDEDIAPDQATAWRENDRLALAGPYAAEEQIDLPDGTHYYDSVKFPLFDAAGTLYGTCGVSSDVTHSRRLVEAMREANEQAVAVARHKSAFLATMSHEIRTPLNGVLGLTALLLDSQLTEQQQEWATQAQRSGHALLQIVNDVLDLSKVEAGRIDLERVPFALSETVEDVLAVVREAASMARLDLVVETAPGLPPRRIGDPGRLRQVLLNLVSNAVKFTPAGTVTVRLLGDEAKLVLEVQDTGIGMTKEARDKVFTAFAQADASTSRTYGGTGLGLAIVRGLVEAMDGTVGVWSSPGLGSTFRVTLPLPVAVEQVPVPVPAARDGQVRLTGSVLVAEDNPVNQLVARTTLQSLGLTVTVVEDGQAAVEAAAAATYDLILMDVQMPHLDGYQATGRIRRSGNAVPIVAVTAGAFDQDRQAAITAGMDGFLPKPWTQGQLLAMLHEHLPATAVETPALS